MIVQYALLASLAAAQTAGPSVAMLQERFVSAVETADKTTALEALAKTPPISGKDVSALFDLFSREQDVSVRRAVMDPLALIAPDSPQLEPIFINYLKQPEPETQLFGINGAFRLRSRQALPLIRAIAKRRFVAARASDVSVLSERNAWWTQYEALSALAQWEPEKSLSLLRKKSDESPEVAHLLGRFFWKKTLPDLKKWFQSQDPDMRQKALIAAKAPIEPADARATREAMLEVVRDPAVDGELRHQLALKVGACSDDVEAEALLREHDKAPDDQNRLLWASAAFASRSRKAVPLLVRYALDSKDELWRRAAKAQLLDMVGAEMTQALLSPPKSPEK